MMSLKNSAFKVILTTIIEANYPVSKQKLWDLVLDNDIEVSERSIERYLKELQEYFFIEKTKKPNGYQLNKLREEGELNIFMDFIHINQVSSLAANSIANNQLKKKYILPETNQQFKGVEHLEKLLDAIAKNNQVSFIYNKQYTDSSTRIIVPQLIKQYQNRWYLVALDTNKEHQIRVFGLDRITELEVLKVSSYIEDENSSLIFSDIVGVDTRPTNPSYPKPIKVLLKAYASQPNYFKSLPLHSSQKLISETDDTALFEYYLMVNYEFKQHLYMYTPFIEVLEPLWLRKQIKDELQSVINLHN